MTPRSGRPRAVMAFAAGLLVAAAAVRPAAAQPPAPSSLKAETGQGVVRVGWAAVPSAAGYRVYRSLRPRGPYTLLGNVSAGEVGWGDQGVANGIDYYYVVRSVGPSGEEGPSSVEAHARGDTVAPSASLRSLEDGRHFSGRGPAGIEGDATDAGSGVAEVRVAVRRTDTMEWWDGTQWDGHGQTVELPATLSGTGTTVRWTYDASRILWSQATGYQVRLSVRDRAGYALDPAESASVYVDAPANLMTSVAAAPGAVTVGQPVNVSVLVANTGGSEAVNVRVEPPVPLGSSEAAVAAAPPAATVPSLAPGEFATFSWTFTTTAAGTLRFKGAAKGANGPTGEPAESVTGISNDLVVRLPARLAVDVTPSPANVREGDSFSVRMRVTNTGQSEARVTAAALTPLDPSLAGKLSGPDGAMPFTLRGGESRELAWTASAAGAGRLKFSGAASGYDVTSGAAADSAAATSAPVGVAAAPAGIQLAASAGSAVTGSKVTVTATVRDASGTPVPGVPVTFLVLAGKGRVERPTVVTGEGGVADTALAVGAEAGINTIAGQAGSLLGSISVETVLPGGAEQILSRNFFDPSRGESVDVKVFVPSRGPVQVRVFSLSGELVATLADATAPAGNATYAWNGKDAAGQTAANGVYFVSVRAGSTVLSRRVVVLKR